MKTANDLVKKFTEVRKSNKNKWYLFCENYNGFHIQMKCYNTWIQIIRVAHNDRVIINSGSPMDMKVKELNKWLNDLLNNLKH